MQRFALLVLPGHWPTSWSNVTRVTPCGVCSRRHTAARLIQWEAAARLIAGDAAYLRINHSNSNYVPHRNIPIAKFLEAPFRFSCCKDNIWDCCLVFKLYLATPGLQLTRLLCLWGLPGKNTGVGCHFLLQRIFSTPEIGPTSPALAGGFSTTEPPGKPLFEISSTLTWAYYIITKEQLICICNNVNDLVLTVGWRPSVRNRIKKLLGETIRELTHTIKPCWKKRPKKCTYQVVHRKTLILPRYRLYLYKPKKKIPEVFFLRKNWTWRNRYILKVLEQSPNTRFYRVRDRTQVPHVDTTLIRPQVFIVLTLQVLKLRSKKETCQGPHRFQAGIWSWAHSQKVS